MKKTFTIFLMVFSITINAQKGVIDSTYFSYKSPCNIRIDFLKNKKIIVTFDNTKKLCSIEPLYDENEHLETGFYKLLFKNKLLYYISFSDGVFLVNQHYEIGCESSKTVMLYPLYSIKEKVYSNYYDDIEYFFENDNGEAINNKAFYLNKYKDYKTTVYLLNKIIEKFPTRLVAYLNLADCYWETNEKEKAKENYKKYIQLMKEQKKDLKRIPKYVFERIK